MDAAQVLVTVAGGVLIVGVLVFFFGPRRGRGPKNHRSRRGGGDAGSEDAATAVRL